VGGEAHGASGAVRPGQGGGRCALSLQEQPVSDSDMEELAQAVEDALRSETSEPTSQQVGVAVLERLQALDDVAYLRFASVYKGFEDAGDFQRESASSPK